jgi:hypothetical protein
MRFELCSKAAMACSSEENVEEISAKDFEKNFRNALQFLKKKKTKKW